MEYSLNSFDLLGPGTNLEAPWPRALRAELGAMAQTLETIRSKAMPLPWQSAETPTAILPDPGNPDGPPAIPGHLRTVRPRAIAVSSAASVLFVPEPEPDALRPYEDHEDAWFGGEVVGGEDQLPLWAAAATVISLGGIFLSIVALVAVI